MLLNRVSSLLKSAAAIIWVIFIACSVLTICSCAAEKESEAALYDTKIKTAVFAYTGSKYQIHEFVVSGLVRATGDENISESDGRRCDNLAMAESLGVYVIYRDNYENSGLSAIILSWDTEKVNCCDVTVQSGDKSFSQIFGDENGLYEKSEKWYYFKEPDNDLAVTGENTEKTDEYTPNETELFENHGIECAEGEAAAYIEYSDISGTRFYRYEEKYCTLKAENAKITGEGDYAVSLLCDVPVKDMKHAVLIIKNGENVFPQYTYNVTKITVDKKAVRAAQNMIGKDENGNTVVSIYNTQSEYIPKDEYAIDSNVNERSYIIISQSSVRDWTELTVYFTVSKRDAKADGNNSLAES